jgi:hypothetical protein
VLDFSNLCRRQTILTIHIHYRLGLGALHLLIDSPGVKSEGDGEWLAKKLEPSKPKDWRKVHLGIDPETLEMRAIEMTSSRVGDAPVLRHRLAQIPANWPLGIVTADVAYDTRTCHAAIAARGAAVVIPSCRSGKSWRAHGRSDRALRCRAQLSLPWPRNLEATDRLPPTKSGRNKVALPETLGRARDVSRLRPSSRRTSDQGGHLELVHQPLNTPHAVRRADLFIGTGCPDLI